MEMPVANPAILARKAQIVARLSAALPKDAVIHDPAETRAYECDGLTAYRCPPLCVVLPDSTEEVSAVLKICHDEGVPVVPRGAGTSLAGGALPTADSVILGVARLNEVLDTDYDKDALADTANDCVAACRRMDGSTSTGRCPSSSSTGRGRRQHRLLRPRPRSPEPPRPTARARPARARASSSGGPSSATSTAGSRTAR